MAKVIPYTHPQIIGDFHYKEEDSFLLSSPQAQSKLMYEVPYSTITYQSVPYTKQIKQSGNFHSLSMFMIVPNLHNPIDPSHQILNLVM
jgi:hypothetical protein